MDIEFCANQRPGNPAHGLCDEYRLSAIARFDDLLNAYCTLAADHPGHRLLLSLDDVHQARYTSGHARNNLGLDDVIASDLQGLPAQCFEDGEHIGYLTCKQEFPICARNFMNLVATSSFQAACDFGLTLDESGLQEWLDYQHNPLPLLDQPVSAIVVPVAQACEALAAFPNGYFSCDLSPEHNYAVARHLSLNYGYELFGVGASYLGLLRAAPADSTLVQALATDLCALYNTPQEARASRVSAFAQAIAGRRHLWLRYVE